MNNYLATKCSFGIEALKVKGAINGFTDTLCPFLTGFLVLSMALYSPEYNEDPKCIQCRKHPEKHKEVKIQCLFMGLVEPPSSPTAWSAEQEEILASPDNNSWTGT